MLYLCRKLISTAELTLRSEEAEQLDPHGGSVKVSREIKQADDLLREVLGEGTYWLRPPYGKLDEAQKAQIPVPMVQWSVDSRDWESKNTEKIVETVLAQAEPNNIILMHDIYPTSVESALKIVDMLQAEGYWFVTVEELLCLNGIEPQAGVLYRFGK